MALVPVWVWLPGAHEPVQAAELEALPRAGRFRYLPAYLARSDALTLDPVELRMSRRVKAFGLRGEDGLPGVVRDAKPSGYGADRLSAHAAQALSPIELLEQGAADGVGAIEACKNIERKLAWKPHALADLAPLLDDLDRVAPASRAVRRLLDDLETSAGGERPKLTVAHERRLWLAKLQDRADRPLMPAREWVAMRLARAVGLDAAQVELHTFGAHQALLVERFDREGDPMAPARRLYASAHTVLMLQPSAVRGDIARSYLNLADRMRVWMRGETWLAAQLAELWRRMSFNALVGNTDDHPLNHGLLLDEGGWKLSPAFDITPIGQGIAAPGPVLAMATGADGSAQASVERLVKAAPHFGVEAGEARTWIERAAGTVASDWEPMLRGAAKPVAPDASRLDAWVGDVRPSFAFAELAATRA